MLFLPSSRPFLVPSSPHLAVPDDSLLWRALASALLGIACVTDVRARRIPNALVLALLAAGLVRLPFAGAPAAGLATGALAAGGAVLAGLLALVPLYATRVLGAGDVKLFAALGAWLGTTGLLDAAVWTALAGGVLATGWIAAQAVASRLRPAAAAAPVAAPAAGRVGSHGVGRVGGRRPGARLPYGVAIAAGGLAALWLPVA